MAEKAVKAKPNVEETEKQVTGAFGVGELHPTIEKYYKENPDVAKNMMDFFESERKAAKKGGGKLKSKKRKSKKRKSKRKKSRKSRKRSKTRRR